MTEFLSMRIVRCLTTDGNQARSQVSPRSAVCVQEPRGLHAQGRCHHEEVINEPHQAVPQQSKKTSLLCTELAIVLISVAGMTCVCLNALHVLE
jgi:hypothetical protein